MRSLHGKTAIVTGAAQGMGRATAEALSRRGANVVLVDIDEAAALRVATDLTTAGGTALAFKADVCSADQTREMVARTIEEFGAVHILINNAGVLRPSRVCEITEEEWDDVFTINAKALFFMMREVVGQSMVPRRQGAVVNFSSIAGIAGMRKPLCSALYSGSKGAAAAITRQGAMEWAEYGVRVNAVASGGVLTEMTMSLIGDDLDKATALVPLGRLSQPEEVASLVAYDASDLAANITGQIVVIDGGGYGAQADPGYL
ncbi:MAG: SDR family NAD(P)-dependent oxidoreductase, partial [Terrimicrobiaceae bacterium]